MKRDCEAYKAWNVKRCNKLTCSVKVNLIDVSPQYPGGQILADLCIYITNSLQGFLSKRLPKNNEVSICVRNGTRVVVKAVGVVKLEFGPRIFIYLDNVYYVPSMRRNLVSVSILVKKQCTFYIDLQGIKISHDSHYLGSATSIFVNDYWVCHVPTVKKFC